MRDFRGSGARTGGFCGIGFCPAFFVRKQGNTDGSAWWQRAATDCGRGSALPGQFVRTGLPTPWGLASGRESTDRGLRHQKYNTLHLSSEIDLRTATLSSHDTRICYMTTLRSTDHDRRNERPTRIDLHLPAALCTHEKRSPHPHHPQVQRPAVSGAARDADFRVRHDDDFLVGPTGIEAVAPPESNAAMLDRLLSRLLLSKLPATRDLAAWSLLQFAQDDGEHEQIAAAIELLRATAPHGDQAAWLSRIAG